VPLARLWWWPVIGRHGKGVPVGKANRDRRRAKLKSRERERQCRHHDRELAAQQRTWPPCRDAGL
jgi:hypothetical protein